MPPESSGGVTCFSRTRSISRRASLRDRPERLLVGVEDRGHHERVLGGHGQAHVHVGVVLELPVAVGGVDARVLAQGGGGRLHHHVVVGGSGIGHLLQALAQLHRRRHVHVEGEREVRSGGLRLGHAPRHGLLEAGELVDLHRRPWRRPRRGRAPARCGGAASPRRAPLPPAAASTSAFTIRPPGPVPSRRAISTPRSRATRRATGDAFTRSPPDAGGDGLARAGGSRSPLLLSGSAGCSFAFGSASGSLSRPPAAPQTPLPPRRCGRSSRRWARVSPSWATISISTPSVSAS